MSEMNRWEPTSAESMDQTCLREVDLARRWNISRRTLQRWRKAGSGPAWLVLGGIIVYRLTDVVRYEEARLHGADQ